MQRFNNKNIIKLECRKPEGVYNHVLYAILKDGEEIALAYSINTGYRMVKKFIPVGNELHRILVSLSEELDENTKILVLDLIQYSMNVSNIEGQILDINVDIEPCNCDNNLDGKIDGKRLFIDIIDERGQTIRIFSEKVPDAENTDVFKSFLVFPGEDIARIQKALYQKYSKSKDFKQIKKIFEYFRLCSDKVLPYDGEYEEKVKEENIFSFIDSLKDKVKSFK